MFRLPQGVRRITNLDLMQAGVLDGTQWAVVARWECQDLSPAGSCEGLTGLHSSTFFDLLRVMGTLQQLLPDKPPMHLLENALWRLFQLPTAVNQQPTNQASTTRVRCPPTTFDAAWRQNLVHHPQIVMGAPCLQLPDVGPLDSSKNKQTRHVTRKRKHAWWRLFQSQTAANQQQRKNTSVVLSRRYIRCSLKGGCKRCSAAGAFANDTSAA